jgi:DEAD/DEAH box helicase domain-containing protein
MNPNHSLLPLSIHAALEFFPSHAAKPSSIAKWVLLSTQPTTATTTTTTNSSSSSNNNNNTKDIDTIIKYCHQLAEILPDDFGLEWRKALDDENDEDVVLQEMDGSRMVQELTLRNGKRGKRERIKRLKEINLESGNSTSSSLKNTTTTTTDSSGQSSQPKTRTKRTKTSQSGPIIFFNTPSSSTTTTPVTTTTTSSPPTNSIPTPPLPWITTHTTTPPTFNPLGTLAYLQQSQQPSALEYVLGHHHHHQEQINHHHHSIPVHTVTFLHPIVLNRLTTRWNITNLYQHQCNALETIICEKKSIIMTSPTASGKTVVFASSIVHSIMEERSHQVQDTGGGFVLPSSRKTSLILYPTKALARDQHERLRKFMNDITISRDDKLNTNIIVEVVDGDTPPLERNRVRDEAQIILTNPDFLHATMLPNLEWRNFIRDLHYVVIDESHVYDASFGSHVAHVLRRLQRLVSSLNNNSQISTINNQLQFILCSATIANPIELFEFLIGVSIPFSHITGLDDFTFTTSTTSTTTPLPSIVRALWRPRLSLIPPPPPPHHHHHKQSSNQLLALDDEISSNSSAAAPPPISSIYECATLLYLLVKCNIRTLAFCRTRKLVELVLKYTRKLLVTNKVDQDKIRAYRGGYQPEERREIEQSLLRGDLLGVCATNALELGMDIGSLDAVLVLGFPGSISSLFQQFGRCGRNGRPGLAIMIMFQSPIDVWALNNSSRFLTEKRFESVIGEMDNDILLSQHLMCAVGESSSVSSSMLMLSTTQGGFGNFDVEKDGKWWYPHVPQHRLINILHRLANQGSIISSSEHQHHHNRNKSHHTSTSTGTTFKTTNTTLKSHDFSLRVIDSVSILVYDIDTNKVLDEIPYHRAFFSLFVGAVHMHQGNTYLITSMSLEQRRANARKTAVDYFTSAMDSKDVDIIKVLQQYTPHNNVLCEGVCRLTWKISGYKKIPFQQHQIQKQQHIVKQYEAMELPPLIFETTAVWANVSQHVFDVLGSTDHQASRIFNGLHALSHLICKLLPLFSKSAGCMSVIHEPSNTMQAGRMVLYDSQPGGGSGVTHVLFERFKEVLEDCEQVLLKCSCGRGCNECVFDGSCTLFNEGCGDKEATMICLKDIMNQLEKSNSNLVSNNHKKQKQLSPLRLRETNYQEVGTLARLSGAGRIMEDKIFKERLNVGEEWRANNHSHNSSSNSSDVLRRNLTSSSSTSSSSPEGSLGN